MELKILTLFNFAFILNSYKIHEEKQSERRGKASIYEGVFYSLQTLWEEHY